MNDTVSKICTDQRDITAVKKVISHVFGCNDYMDAFFELPINKTVFAYMNRDAVYSCGILISSGRYGYVYSVCVPEEHRGKGYFRSICGDIIQYGSDKYDRIFLVPSSESLFAPYSAFGFDKALFRKSYDCNGLTFVSCGVNDNFYSIYSECVDFVIDKCLLELYLKYSGYEAIAVFRAGILIGFGIADRSPCLKSFYPLCNDCGVTVTGSVKIALSVDYISGLTNITDGIYID